MRTLVTLDDRESEILLDYLARHTRTGRDRKCGYRNHAMTAIMVDAGLRVGELVRLRQQNLFVNGEPVEALHVPKEIAKGKTARTVPLTQRARLAIGLLRRQYWTIFAGNPDYFAFYRYSPSSHLTTRQVERIIKFASLRCLGRPIHPHALRHTFATNLQRVTSTRTVQQMLGHKNLSSTMIYTHPDFADAKEAIQKMEHKTK